MRGMLASTVARSTGADRGLDPSDLDQALQRLGVLETERALAAWLWSSVRSATVIGARTIPICRPWSHYAEMIAVMFLGMFVLMAPTGMLFSAFGTSWSRLSPAMNMFAMALTMTVPMVGWMRYRGHAWRPNMEMAASMLIPTFAVMGVLWAGLASSGALMVPEHVGMLGCMLAAMLLRREEYSCAGRARGRIQPAAA
jgi:hypothetical protein